jgi:ATP-dependent Zn protease
MGTESGVAPLTPATEASRELHTQWRRLARAATAVAILTSPAVFVWLHNAVGWSVLWSVIATILLVAAYRGLVEVLLRRLIPWPSLFGVDDERTRAVDVLDRRRAWFWSRFYRRLVIFGSLFLTVILGVLVVRSIQGESTSFADAASDAWHGIAAAFGSQQFWIQLVVLPLLFLVNFAILFGPLMLMGIMQIKGYEPGDADWGVRLDDVRGQAEAKEEVRRVVSLWQSGEAFERAGGKRERGLLFLGQPGTGKTMLAKAIATGFNSPFVSIPGSGFAQTFMGMDAVIVRFLARKAKKLARKWGGQCIVFIDEIDAVGMRRSSLAGGGGETGGMTTDTFHDHCFYGPNGALTPTGDLILETRAWRERLFAERAARPTPRFLGRFGAIVNQVVPGMMGGMGQLALNQLLVVMDGIDDPPLSRRLPTKMVNTLLDAIWVVPNRVGRVPLRLRPPKPRTEQIYFIGATNVPIDVLDPALTRPGRLGRHVWLRTPTKQDRLDIFDLYLGKVSHEPDLDTEKRRDEIARVTNGYAQPLDANVLTPNGWKRMGDVRVGDVLIGVDGQSNPVRAVHARGEMDVFRMTFNDGTSTECTADHLWTLEAADPRMVQRTFTTAELLDRGLRWSPNGSRFYLPALAPAEFDANEELPLDPYLLGLLLGDGGFSYGTPDFCTADEENLAAVAALLPVGVSLAQHGPRNWRLSGGSRKGVPRSLPNPMTAKLRDLRLWGVHGHEKFVPEMYKWAMVEERLALLQGLMDSDGTRDYRRGTGATFYSHSKRLAQDVAFVVRSLGGTARVRDKRQGWRVAVDLPERFVPFRLSRKADAYRRSRKPFRKRILKVEPIGKKPVQCVTVTAEDGLYVTDDFVLTHNSPAMIEQVCSMALTYAHHSGRERFAWEDLVEATTTIESGMAINIEYIPEETRAVAIHEAGHAAAGHAYMKEAESTRLSIRRRGSALGHHQALEKEERFSSWRHEEIGRLIWTLGAMAAERVFYGENSTGVGGDVQSATARAAWMVGACAMGPDRSFANGRFDDETAEQTQERISKRFQALGKQIMNRTAGGGPFSHDPIASVLSDREQRDLVSEMLGQAYLAAYHLIDRNQKAVEHIADVLVERREIHGDEVIALLDEAKLEVPEVDLRQEESWPRL